MKPVKINQLPSQKEFCTRWVCFALLCFVFKMVGVLKEKGFVRKRKRGSIKLAKWLILWKYLKIEMEIHTCGKKT